MLNIQKYILFLFIIIIPFALQAQVEYGLFIEEGQRFVQQRKYDQAEESYKKALDRDDKNPLAYLKLGELMMAQKEWQKAKDWFNKVVEMEPDNIEAHYQLGICDREDSVGRDILFKRLMWRNSRKHFEKVIEQDPAYRQVYYEFAMLRRYQENWEEAIELTHKQLAVNPGPDEPKIAIFNFYDLFITYGGEQRMTVTVNKDQYQTNWLKNRNTDYDLYFLGENYRRMELFDKADSIFNILMNKRLSFTKVPVQLSRVRLYYQTGQPQQAEKIYFGTLNLLSSFLDIRFIYDDAKYILSDSDLRTKFNSFADIRNFYRKLWKKKDPLASSKINYRLYEHYRRLIFAEKEYRYDRIRLPIHNPDRMRILRFPEIFYKNTKFNDKGLVYIRYGQPDEKARQIGDLSSTNESWMYHETADMPKLIFHFETHEHAPPGDWRLVPVPTDRAALEARLGWDQKLDQYYMATNEMDQNSVMHEIQMNQTKQMYQAMNSEHHTWHKELKPIPMYTSAARFLNDEGDYTLEVYLGVPRNTFFDEVPAGETNLVQTGVSMVDTTWQTIYKENKNLEIARSDTLSFTKEMFIDIFRTNASPDKFHLAAHVRDSLHNKLGGNRLSIELEPMSKNELAVSDLMLAYSVKRADKLNKYFRHGYEVIPNPTNYFKKNDLIYFYYEIYNLEQQDGLSNYKIEQTAIPVKGNKNLISRFMGLFSGGDSKQISISKVHQGNERHAYEYTAFDFKNFDSGKVEMVIAVTDLNSGETAESRAVFTLDD